MATETEPRINLRIVPPGPAHIAVLNADRGALVIHRIMLERLYDDVVVHTFDDVPALLTFTRQRVVHLLIIDYMLPTISGYDLVKQLREDTDWDPVPIILETTYFRSDLTTSYLDIGVDAVLNMPFYQSELGTKLRPFMNRPMRSK